MYAFRRCTVYAPQSSRFKHGRWGETAESKTDYFGPYSDEYRYVPVATGTDWGGCEPFKYHDCTL
jgi:hypothetical protein